MIFVNRFPYDPIKPKPMEGWSGIDVVSHIAHAEFDLSEFAPVGMNTLEHAKKEAENILQILPQGMRVHHVIENLISLLEYRTSERDELQSRINQVAPKIEDSHIRHVLTGDYPAISMSDMRENDQDE